MTTAPAAASFPGPDALGRGVVVAPDAPTPPGFAHAPRLRVDDEVLRTPAHVATVLADRWLHRQRTIVELAVDPTALRAPEVLTDPPHALDRDAGLHRERLQAMVWANSYDLRTGTPRWWHGVLAQRHAGAGPSTRGDVALPDGRACWVDGGPRGPLVAALPPDDDLPLAHRESIALGALTPLGAAHPDADLAPDQLAAVAHHGGPARILAPAGSGKTRVLTARLRHLLADRGIEPQLVMAVAYNTRAAAELKERTAGLPARIRTLHSLALWICTLDERREVIHERDVRTILSELVRTARVPNQDPFQPYLDALAEVRLALRDPSDVEVVRGDVDGFADAFDRYRKVLAERRLLDFDEQIYRALELLLTRPDIRATVQRACTHLLVDEFQDLTPAFLLLVRLAAGPTAQVFAVGDDDQTIYSYAGATPDHLVDLGRWFPGAADHPLEVNYRCPPTVVDATVTLLSHNRNRVSKAIRAGSEGPPDAQALTVVRDAADALGQRAVTAIADLLQDGARPAHLAVLARVNSALLPVQVALTEAGVAHTAPLDASVLGRTGIRTALAYLRLGLDLDRIAREDLFDTINRPARKVRAAVTTALDRGRRRGGPFSIGQLRGLVDQLDPSHQERFGGYLDDLRSLEEAITDGADTAACLRLIRGRIGLGEAMDALDASRTRPEGSSHGDDLDALEQLAALQPDPAGFQGWLTERLQVAPDAAGVVLSTVHRVKGLEWPHVLVFAATQGLFPHRLADDVEEERRVFHVAVTRCTTSVTVLADDARPSPFIAELLRAAPPRRDSEDPARPVGSGTGRHRVDAGAVVAAAGLRLTLAGGIDAVVRDARPDGVSADATVGGRTVRLRPVAGEQVVVDGRPVVLETRQPTRTPTSAAVDAAAGTRQRGGRGPDALDQLLDGLEVDEPLYEALRAWRTRTAQAAGMPAYLVLHDRHLRVLAGRRPTTARELAACPGIGPAKLDRFGDDLLDVIDQHSS